MLYLINLFIDFEEKEKIRQKNYCKQNNKNFELNKIKIAAFNDLNFLRVNKKIKFNYIKRHIDLL